MIGTMWVTQYLYGMVWDIMLMRIQKRKAMVSVCKTTLFIAVLNLRRDFILVSNSRQILLLVLSKFMQINWIVFPLKLSGNLWFSDYVRGNHSVICRTKCNLIVDFSRCLGKTTKVERNFNANTIGSFSRDPS